MDVRTGLWRKLRAEELMLLNCGVGEDSWESLGLQYHASNLDWQFISCMIFYMFQCRSPKSSHPLPLPQSLKDCSIHLFLPWWVRLEGFLSSFLLFFERKQNFVIFTFILYCIILYHIIVCWSKSWIGKPNKQVEKLYNSKFSMIRRWEKANHR